MLLGPINLQPRIEASQPFDTSKAQIEQLDGDVWRIRLGNKVVATGFRTEREAQKRLDEIRQGRKA